EALGDDLNIPLALSHLHEMVTQLNKENNLTKKSELKNKILYSSNLMGLLHQDPNVWFQQSDGVKKNALSAEKIEAKIAERNQARLAKDFAKADLIRQELLSSNIILEDKGTMTTWRRL
ncbi:MAG: cysteine--tRNA ligase, partial [Alphaproteobacteria bacterium]|nr:cysteine--tRNA ligase [Alphaproteobacteria bacterium]